MAYSGKLISVKNVIESAYMESGIENIDFSFAMEVTGSLLGVMGIPDVYVSKSTNNVDYPVLTVSNFRCRLPDDLVNIHDMRRVMLDGNGSINNYSEMIESSDVYHSTNTISGASNPNSLEAETNYPISELDEYGDIVTTAGALVEPSSNSQRNYAYTYKVQGNFIFTNFEEGYIELVYRGYPMDDESFPLVPDDEKFKNALKYELIYKLDWKKWRANPASPGLKAVLNDSEQRRDFYVGAARTKARIPTVGQMESIKNQCVRTIPKFREHSNGFKTMNMPETRYNQHRNNRTSR